MWKKITTFLNHERYQVIAVILCILLTVWGLCCQSKVRSIRDPSIYVTRDELTIEVDAYLATAEVRFKSLDQRDAFRALVFEKVLLWSQGGTFNPMGIIPLVIGILGGGAITDNVRKRRELKRLNGTA